MRGTKRKPDIPSDATNGPTGDVLTLAEVSGYLRVSETDLLDLIQSQELPGRCIAGEWRFLKTAIQRWLSAPRSSLQTGKEAQLALAGKYRDDPDLMRICEEAYRQRSGAAHGA